jgi:short-subunit dehydrogenase
MAFYKRKVLMTGASGGIGRHVAALLIQRGATLLTISRSVDRSRSGRHFQADLSTPSGIDAAAAIVAREQPDMLLNLAGIQYCGPFAEQSPANICDSYMVNVIAPVTLCRAALPAMQRRNSGHIVNIGSIFGSIGFAHFASYSSAKAGLRSFSEALRRELVDSGISVTYIAPRAVRTAVITPRLESYARVTGMTIDPPEQAAARIVDAVARRKKDVYFGFPERLFVHLNALMPRLVDRALAAKDRKARKLFAPLVSISERSA